MLASGQQARNNQPAPRVAPTGDEEDGQRAERLQREDEAPLRCEHVLPGLQLAHLGAAAGRTGE